MPIKNSKLLGILFHLSPFPMFTATLNSFSKDRGGKKARKELREKGDFWPHPRFFCTVTTRLARPATAAAATAATATRRGWSDYIMPPVNYVGKSKIIF